MRRPTLFKSIKSRLLLIAIAPIIVVALALSWFYLSTQHDLLNESLQGSGESAATYIAITAELSMYAEDIATLEKLGNSVLNIPSVVSAGFINNENSLLTVVGDSSIITPKRLLPCISNGIFDTELILYICKPIIESTQQLSDFEAEELDEEDAEVANYGWVVLAISREILSAQERANIRFIGSITLSVVLFGSILTLIIARSISAPVLSLENIVSQLGSGKYDSRAKEEGPSETQALARGINSLATAVADSQEQLEQRVEDATRQLTAALQYIGDKNTDLEKAQQDLKLAMAAKDQFLARMSHELRTPLTAVTGFSRLLNQSTMDPMQAQYSENITAASELLLGTIDSILDFSKLQEEAILIESIDFNLREAMESLIAMQAYQAHNKSLEILLMIDSNVPVHLLGDPTRIKQVINNLLSNAIKFTDHGEVMLHIYVLRDDDDEVTLALQVKDSGMGMDQESQARLFQPFTQADDSITRRFGGTGLGLVICKQLLDLMNGKIKLQSELGKGTSIAIELPLKKNTVLSQQQSSVVPSSIDNAQYNILGLDNNALCRRALRSQLSEWQGAVFTVGTEERLIERLEEENQFDLIVIGMALGTIDSNSLSQQLSRIRSHFNGPIVLLSSQSDSKPDAIVAELLQYAPIYQLARPVKQQLLFNTLKTISGETPASISAGSREVIQSLSGLDILVAEDNLYNQQLIQSLLELLGANVYTANNGEEAVSLYQQQHIDVILMDIHMPVMDGITATTNIVANAGDNGIAIIGLTANVMENERQALMDAGAIDILFKPLDEELLVETIAEVTGRTLSKAALTQKGLLETVASKETLQEELTQLLNKIEGLIHAEKYEQAAETVHEIQGLVGIFGLSNISETIQTLSSAIKAGEQPQHLTSMLDSIRLEITALSS